MTARWRSRTSATLPTNGPSSMSHPQVPIVPRMPTDCIAVGDAIGMGHGAGLDHGGDAVLGAFDRRAGSPTARRRRRCGGRAGVPTTGRSTRPGRAGRGCSCAPAGSPVRCWWALIMSRRDDAIRGVDDRRLRVSGTQLAGRADGGDDPVGDDNGTAEQTPGESRFIVTTSPPAMIRSMGARCANLGLPIFGLMVRP